MPTTTKVCFRASGKVTVRRPETNASGEVVCFTTPSGVRAIVATCIPPEALAKLVRLLKGKIALNQFHLAPATERTLSKG